MNDFEFVYNNKVYTDPGELIDDLQQLIENGDKDGYAALIKAASEFMISSTEDNDGVTRIVRKSALSWCSFLYRRGKADLMSVYAAAHTAFPDLAKPLKSLEQGGGNSMKIRQFTIVQFEVNPRTGEYIGSLLDIANNLTKYKTFTEWAWIIHDKDTYTQDAIDDMNNTLRDEAKKKGITDEAAINQYMQNNAWAAVGQYKGKHIHIVGKMNCPLEIWKIAKWLGVPEYLVKNAKGKGAFLDCVEYLTHEDEAQQKLGKYRYDDSCVNVSENFADWRAQLDERQINELKYGKGKTTKQKFIVDVQKYGKTIAQCEREMDPNDFNDIEQKLRRARATYIHLNAKVPNTRLTFYVCGDGGDGKDELCKLLARALCPEYEFGRDIMYAYAQKGVGFDNYDGQPVIIYSDMRAADFMSMSKKGNDRRTVLTALLEPHPDADTVGDVDIKYGATRLIHKYNIINGVDSFEKFVTELAGEYVDQSGVQHHAEKENLEQYYRRIPIIIPVSADYFDIVVNTGIFNGTREYDTYTSIMSITGSFHKMRQICGSHTPLIIDMSKPMIDPIVDTSNKLIERIDKDTMSEEEMKKQIMNANMGVVVNHIDNTTDAHTQAEYDEFVEKWKVINPKKDPSTVMTLAEWVKNGCRTEYDKKKKEWYRPQVTFDDILSGNNT